MIRHVVFFTALHQSDLQRVEDGLRLLENNPHGRVKISRNMRKDDLSTEIDLVVYGEFADEAELAAYKAHPIYQQSIDSVRPLRDLRIVADFVADV